MWTLFPALFVLCNTTQMEPGLPDADTKHLFEKVRLRLLIFTHLYTNIASYTLEN